jgi:hypothetical protein
MPKVTSLGHVGLYVRDIERSKVFIGICSDWTLAMRVRRPAERS